MTETQKKALSKLPAAVRERILKDPSILKKEIESRDKNWPTKNFIPNIAQIRALLCYSEPHETYPGTYPFLLIFRGGNGVGKTCAMALMLVGVCFGNRFLNSEYFHHKYFDE